MLSFPRPISRKLYASTETEIARKHTTLQLSGDATVDDLGDISRSLDCFTSNFS